MWPPPRKKWLSLDAKYVITTLIAIGALLLSGYNSYIATLRTVDEASVVIGFGPTFSVVANKSAFEVHPDQEFIFVNSGTRSITIDAVTLQISQPKNKTSELPKEGCLSGDIVTVGLQYDMTPFVLKPTDMVPKNMNVKIWPDHLWGWKYSINERGLVEIPFYEDSKENMRHAFRVCMSVEFTTFKSDFNRTNILEFDDYFDRDTLLSFGEKEWGFPPIPLVKNDYSILRWIIHW